MKPNFFKSSFILAIVFTLTTGLVYTMAQQSIRQSANDPQIQVAEDTASALAIGTSKPTDFDTAFKIDVAKSLATFAVIYDHSGQPVAGTGELNNALPTVPQGVLATAKKTGEHRITWQPEQDVRVALVVNSYNNGFVAVGRSLREVEKRIDAMTWLTVFAWFLGLSVIVGTTYITRTW